jgi:hypothetical protein
MKIDAPVSVRLDYSSKTRRTLPVRVTWENRDYFIRKLGYHHAYRKGRTLYHVYSVMSDTVFFRIELNTDNLQWTLTEIDDGSVN